MPKKKLSQQADLSQTRSQSPGRETGSFDVLYPSVAEWIKGWGWVEVGRDDYSSSLIRVLDIGGMIWEGKGRYKNVDAAFKAADEVIARFIKENSGHS